MEFDEILNQLNRIKDNGDLVFIKLDGEREKDHITVIISSPVHKQKEQIRLDGEDLMKLLASAVKQYFSSYDV